MSTILTLPLVLSAGLIDGLNPCAFAVMIYLIKNTISKGERLGTKILTYIASVYATYLMIGFLIVPLIQIPELSNTVYLVTAFIAIITGIINTKDFFYYGIGLTLRIPPSQKERIRNIVQKGGILAPIKLGIFSSIFELPCTGSMYLVILTLLNQESAGIITNYLLSYNIMFVTPLLITLLAIKRGYDIERINTWKDENKDYMKLLSGITLIVLGLWMMSSIYF